MIRETYHPARCLKLLARATVGRNEDDSSEREKLKVFKRQLTPSPNAIFAEENLPEIEQLSAALEDPSQTLYLLGADEERRNDDDILALPGSLDIMSGQSSSSTALSSIIAEWAIVEHQADVASAMPSDIIQQLIARDDIWRGVKS